MMFAFTVQAAKGYPAPPFGPPEVYPELGGLASTVDTSNRVYSEVRSLFASMGWDDSRFGTESWNPLGEFIKPGDKVVIKPNLVLHSVVGNPLECIVTHAAVVRIIIDYVLLALNADGSEARGEITIADVPLQSADFGKIVEGAGYAELVEHYAALGVVIRLLDLREHWAVIDESFFIDRQVDLPGDPAGTVLFDLGRGSAHFSVEERRQYSIQDYDDGATQANHQGATHRYRLSRTMLEADVIVNVPKVKTHNKAGVTLGLKNMIGANVSKDYLPHFTVGSPEEGGDEYPERGWYYELTRRVRRLLQKSQMPGARILWRAARRIARGYEDVASPELQSLPHAGSWYGNDTLWRTIVDVNRLVHFGKVNGEVGATAQRRVLYIADGVVGTEGEGPIKGDARPTGLVCVGDNPVEFDAAITMLMGFDWKSVPHIVRATELGFRGPAVGELDELPSLGFRSAPGWAGMIEREEVDA